MTDELKATLDQWLAWGQWERALHAAWRAAGADGAQYVEERKAADVATLVAAWTQRKGAA